MKALVTLALALALAAPAGAGVIHDESVNGDLGTNPAAPTALAFAVGGNTIIGRVNDSTSPTGDRDYITFTIANGQTLKGLNLLAFIPPNTAFAALNAGATSWVPSVATEGNFLSAIHVLSSQVGQDLMPFFVSDSQVSGSLSEPSLGPGQYCFLIQQASILTTTYSLEFVVDGQTLAPGMTWGAIKSLYQ